jgi:hypothetical protein
MRLVSAVRYGIGSTWGFMVLPFFLVLTGGSCLVALRCTDTRLFAFVTMAGPFLESMRIAPVLAFNLSLLTSVMRLTRECEEYGIKRDTVSIGPAFYVSVLFGAIKYSLVLWDYYVILRLPFFDFSGYSVPQIRQFLFNEYNEKGLLGLPIYLFSGSSQFVSSCNCCCSDNFV